MRAETTRIEGSLLVHVEPVSFVDWQVLVFATGAQYRLLWPALDRVPEGAAL